MCLCISASTSGLLLLVALLSMVQRYGPFDVSGVEVEVSQSSAANDVVAASRSVSNVVKAEKQMVVKHKKPYANVR
jgi:hypothetical protein